MGYHADVQNALVAILEAATPGVPVLNGLATTEQQMDSLAQGVTVHREAIDFEPHLPINPPDADDQQQEFWTWIIDVKSGAGKTSEPRKGADVDLLLETIRSAIGAISLTTNCGPMHLQAEAFVGTSGTGVVYRQTWNHERF